MYRAPLGPSSQRADHSQNIPRMPIGPRLPGSYHHHLVFLFLLAPLNTCGALRVWILLQLLLLMVQPLQRP